VQPVVPLYPRGPRSGPGYSVRVHQRLIGPIRPSRGHVPISPSSTYTRCLRCAYLHMPRQPATGSELSLMPFHNMSSSETKRNSLVAYTQYFAEDTGFNFSVIRTQVLNANTWHHEE
jgi:hypothetical protein